MNSPSHYKNTGYPINPQSRYIFKQEPSNTFLPKASIYNHPHTASFKNIPRAQIHTQMPQLRLRYPEGEPRLVDNASDKNFRNRSKQQPINRIQPRTSDLSQCSLRDQLDTISNQQLNNKINTINQKLLTVISRLTVHDQRIKQLSQKKVDKPYQSETSEYLGKEKADESLRRTIEKQVSQQHQVLFVQNKLIKADLDTLKLQILSNAGKNEIKEVSDRSLILELTTKQQIKQIEETCNKKIEHMTSIMKFDMEKLQRQLEQLKKIQKEQMQLSKTMTKENRESLKCLSLKIVQRMLIFKQAQGQWAQTGEQELIYGIDSSGYLTDSEGIYLTDSFNSPIKLEPQKIEILKKYCFKK